MEELKKKAREFGASQENLDALDKKLEQAKDGGEAYIKKKEEEYEEARKKEELMSKETEENLRKKEENRKARDISIAAAAALGMVGIIGLGIAVGQNPETIGLGSLVGKVMAGLAAVGMAALPAPIARIQNWFARIKHRKAVEMATEETYRKQRELGELLVEKEEKERIEEQKRRYFFEK